MDTAAPPLVRAARPLSGARVFDGLLGLLLGLMAVATAIVMLSDIPPVFNQSFATYRAINAALLLTLVLLSALLLVSAATGRAARAAMVVRLLLAWLLTIEAALAVFDACVISVDGSPLPNAFRNASVDGEPVFLHQSTPESPFGFDTPRAEPPVAAGQRVLFLGNSYLRGLGTAGAPSYPRAVDAALKRQLAGGGDIGVFAAGVSGAGVRDDFYIYKLLLEHGYKFDAVVVNLMMQSDLTNNSPGTTRRAVAGQPQRFQDDAFLRHLYPLNSTLFRYLIYFQVTYWQHWAPDHGPAQDASCTPSPSFAAFIRERANYYYGAGAQRRVYLDYNVEQALKIRALAAAHGVPTFAVLLPDPNAGLDAYRQRLGELPMDWDWTRSGVRQKLEPLMPVLDLAPDFRNQYASYRCNDTHWTARGNREGGELVGRWLATRLPAAAHPDPTSISTLSKATP